MEVTEAGNATNTLIKATFSDGDLNTMWVPVDDVPSGVDGVHWTGLGHDEMGRRFWGVLSGRRVEFPDPGTINRPYVHFRFGPIFGEGIVAKRDPATGKIFLGTGGDTNASAQTIGSPFVTFDPNTKAVDFTGFDTADTWNGSAFVTTLALADPVTSGELSATLRARLGLGASNAQLKFGADGTGPDGVGRAVYIDI